VENVSVAIGSVKALQSFVNMCLSKLGVSCPRLKCYF